MNELSVFYSTKTTGRVANTSIIVPATKDDTSYEAMLVLLDLPLNDKPHQYEHNFASIVLMVNASTSIVSTGVKLLF